MSDGRRGHRYRSITRDRASKGASACDQRAQGLVEYGLIIALVAILAIGALLLYGPAIDAMLGKLSGSV